jgi:hypothetical protein
MFTGDVGKKDGQEQVPCYAQVKQFFLVSPVNDVARVNGHDHCRNKLNQSYQSYAEWIFGHFENLPADQGGLHGQYQDKEKPAQDITPEFRIV